MVLVNISRHPRSRSMSHRSLAAGALAASLMFVATTILPARGRADQATPSFGALSADGSWDPLPTPPRGGHTVVRDPARDRLILFGGSDPVLRNDLWWMPGDGSFAWSPLQATGPGPQRREHHTAIFDAFRDRLLVFGGDSGAVTRGVSNEVWSLSFSGSPTWQLLVPSGTPPAARGRHAAVYDPVRDRLLVFGGNDGTGPLADVWELTLSGTPTWNPIVTAGTPPAARYFHSMIYDPMRDRLIVYGGQVDDNKSLPLDDLWALDLSGTPTWSTIVPVNSGPGEITAHTAIYDPLHDSMVVLSGYGVNELLFTPVPTWVTHSTPDVSLGDGEFGGCYDGSRQRLIVMGGRGYFIERFNQTWAIDLLDLSWSPAAPEVPTERSAHTMIYDSARRQLVLYGGASYGVNDAPGEYWLLPLGGSRTWTRVTGAGTGPGLLIQHSAIFAPTRGSMVVCCPGSGANSQVWELDLNGPPSWSQLSIAGTQPSPRAWHTAVYDAARDRMVVFGGAPQSGGIAGDVWALALSGTPAWSLLTPSGTPPSPRYDHAAIYDPVGDRMVVFGGRTGSSTVTNEVWSLAFTPTPTWAHLFPSETGPLASEGSSAAYDPSRRRMLIHGSQGNNSSVWALALDGPPAWSKLLPSNAGAVGRSQSALAFDVDGDRLALFAGQYNTAFEPVFLRDTWMLAFGTPLAVPKAPRGVAIELSAPLPNPASRASTIRYTLPHEMRGRLAIHDVTGRRVRLLETGVLVAGPHAVSWDLRSDGGTRVAAGIYWCQLSSDAGSASRRMVVLD
jgi:hypothetical protein